MAWHLEAVGSGGVRAAQADDDGPRGRALRRPRQDLPSRRTTQFEFPRIVKEDSPNVSMGPAMADLLSSRRTGPSVVRRSTPWWPKRIQRAPRRPRPPTRRCSATRTCTRDAQGQDGSDKKGGGDLPTSATKAEKKSAEKAKFAPEGVHRRPRRGSITAFNRYICYMSPTSDKDANSRYIEVGAAAAAPTRGRRWEEAALAFKDVALNHADKDVGIYASQLYLESLNVMGSGIEPTRPSCFDDIADVPKFIELYCKGAKEKENAGHAADRHPA